MLKIKGRLLRFILWILFNYSRITCVQYFSYDAKDRILKLSKGGLLRNIGLFGLIVIFGIPASVDCIREIEFLRSTIAVLITSILTFSGLFIFCAITLFLQIVCRGECIRILNELLQISDCIELLDPEFDVIGDKISSRALLKLVPDLHNISLVVHLLLRAKYFQGVLKSFASMTILAIVNTVALNFCFFYAVMLLFSQLYEHLNMHLTLLMTRIRQVAHKSQKCTNRMQKLCDLADEIDKIASLHRQLQTLCNQFFGFHQVQIILVLVCLFSGSLNAIITLYSNILFKDSMAYQSLLSVLINIVNMLLIISSIYGVQTEFLRTREILEDCVSIANLDERLEIDLIMQKLTIEKLCFRPCGLFEINDQLLYPFFMTIIGMALFLVQCDQS